jgi:hypothetical protein
MHPIRIDRLSAEQHAELDRANRTAKDGRVDAHVGPLSPSTSISPAMRDEHPPSEGKVSRELLRLAQAVFARNPSNRATPACRACRSASPLETPRKLTR